MGILTFGMNLIEPTCTFVTYNCAFEVLSCDLARYNFRIHIVLDHKYVMECKVYSKRLAIMPNMVANVYRG